MRDSPIYSTSYTDLSGYVPYTDGTANITIAHDIEIDSDSKKLFFGDGQDANIYYDGTDLIIESDLVGTGNVKFTNDIHLDSNKKLTLGTGANASVYFNGTNLILDPAEAGNGAVKINDAVFAFADVVTIAQGTTAIDVRTGNIFEMDGGRTGTTVVSFTNSFEGQMIIFRATNDDVTMANGAFIQLDGSANFVMAEGDTITLVKFSGNKFIEISRMVV